MRLPIKQFESRVHHHLLLRASNPRRPISNLRAPATLYTLHPANLLYPCRQGRKSFGFHSGKFAGLDHVMSDHYLAAGREVPEGAERSRADKEEDPILQYVVLRRDLYTELKWPLGSVVAQACHAATAALWESRGEETTQLYCAPESIGSMHKVVLEVKGETQLQNLATKLQEAGVRHKLWIEQPEVLPTCLAAAPARKSNVQQYFKKLKLCNF